MRYTVKPHLRAAPTTHACPSTQKLFKDRRDKRAREQLGSMLNLEMDSLASQFFNYKVAAHTEELKHN